MANLWQNITGTVKTAFKIGRTNTATLDASGLTASRAQALPDKAGTLVVQLASGKIDGITNGTATGEALTFDAIGASVQAYSASTTLLGNTVTGTGSIVLATSPTLVTPVLGVASATSLACPKIIGGTDTTSTLTFQPTSGVGATGADIIWANGNNGATEALRLTHAGNLILPNNRGYQIKSLAGVASNVMKINSSNTLEMVSAAGGSVVLYHDGGNDGAGLLVYDAGGRANVGVGVGTSAPLGAIEARTTSGAQLVASYDGSNYLSTTVSSAGSVNFAAVGASAAFVFNAPVTASAGFITGNIILYSSTVSVPTATNVTINVRASTSTMATGYCYRVRLNTAGTGTSTGAVYIINQTAATPTWVATAVSVAGSTSNHPLLLVSGSSIQVYHNHGSTYLVSYVVETIQHNNGTVNAATIWGADSLFTGTDSTSITTASGYALGVGTLPSAKIHAVSTTEQLRLGFDSSNYYSTTVSSGGAVTFDAVGASAGFTFSDAVTVAGTLFLTGTLPYVDVKPSGWASSGYIQFGVSPSFAASGNYGGLYVPAGKGIAFTQAGTTLLLIDVGGNVGVGSTAPLAKFESRATSGAQIVASFDASNYLSTTVSSAGAVTFDSVGASAGFSFSDSVAIGVATPLYPLHVNLSSGDNQLYVSSGTPSSVAGDSYLTLGSSRADTGVGHICKIRSVAVSAGKADLAFLTQPSNGVYTERMRVDNAGNVGIGITAPTAFCHTGASTTVRASLCLPHGSAPTTPVNGDMWTTTAGLFTRINGVTNGVGDVVGPSSSVTGAASVFSGTTGKLLRASPTVTYYSVAAGAEDKIEFGATFKDFRTATDGATVTFDLDLSDQWQVTFAGNRTLAISNASIGQVITILRYQDATGNRTPTWWANIAWDNGLAPVDVPTASGWSMTVLACVGLDAYSVPNWKEVCRSTSAPLTGITTATDGATVTFDLRVSPRQKVTLAGNRTLALTSGSYYVGQTFDIKLTQDATGSRTVTWFSTVRWAGGTTPTLTTIAGRSDWFRLICTVAGGSPKFDCLGTSMNLLP